MKKLTVSALLTSLMSLTIGVSAHADASFGIRVNQTSMVTGGQVVAITVNNLPADKGIYIQQCVLVSGAPDLTKCTSMQTNPASVLWVTNSAASQAQGGANPVAPQAFTLVSQIGETSCITSTCGLVTARDHLGRSDRSLDSVTPLAFSALTPALDKTTSLLDAHDSITVSLAGLGETEGVYVRLCAANDLTERPADCDGLGVWASNNTTALTMGAITAASPISLPVRGAFTSGSTRIDCQVVSCGVFIRRDHFASSDSTLDTFIPVTFTKPVQTTQGAGKWLKASGTHTAKISQTIYLASTATKTAQGSSLSWKSQTPTVCSVRTIGTKIAVKFAKIGRCAVIASAKSNSRLKAANFNWSFTVKR